MAIEITRAVDGVAVVTMNRPEALNAFNTAELRAFVAAFTALHDDRTIRAIILTGAGEKSFAAGADIKEMAAKSRAEGHEFGRMGHAAANAIENAPAPVIAAVNGYAFGGGCELALACDFRLASENAQFAQPEVSLGIPPGWGATQRLPRVVGPGMAAELIFTGRRIKADEALRIGLVNAVLPLAELMPKALELAGMIAANSPAAVRTAKAAMHLAFDGNVRRGLDAERDLFGEAFAGADQREGMAAFVEKRKAVFTGE